MRKYGLLTGVALLLGMAGVAAAEEFNLDALIEAAKKEPPITVYGVSGKIVDTAEAFTKAYGVQATGKKVNEAGQADLVIREHQAGNALGDVSLGMDVGAAVAQVLPQGMAESWTPPDMAGDIAESLRNPLVVISDPQVWSYNTEKYATCPVKNIWELTEPKWKGKVAMLDPFEKPLYTDWFNQLATHHDAAVAKAYEDHFGKKLETDEASATAAWVKAYAANGPLIGDSGVVSEAIGAAGQAEPFFGITATAKYRDNASKGLKLGLCDTIQPFAGFLYPSYGLIAAKSDSPNTAKLFIRFLMTEEGIANQMVDGKPSGNGKLALPADEASGVARHMDRLMAFSSASAGDDFETRQDWQDLWRVNYSK
ncbi:MAG TPA: ABC transporter substrate-binding protein [Shinella sp.]|jgi:iron(III) transport system substrate-binding protein|nr:ABC transporter substrate-binding protein [Shinella sp.]